MTSGQFLGCLTLLYSAGMVVPILWNDRTPAQESGAPLDGAALISLALALLGSLLAVVVGGGIAFGWMNPFPPNAFLSVPWFKDSPILIEAVQFMARVDRFSAFFVLIIGGFSALVAIYSFDALKAKHLRAHRHRIAAASNAFVGSTLAVVVVADCLSLLIALEVMSLSFGYLVLFKQLRFQEQNRRKGEESRRHNARLAPQLYLITSHTSSAFLLLAITILGLHAKSLGFQEIADHAKSLDGTTASVVFLLVMAGLGARIGLVPAHIWVPLVHPESPAPTHAFSLGIAIKVGVYLMCRFFVQFLDPQPWWGYTLLVVAVVTALVTVWYAITCHDLKTALAYHSIENIGIMTAGLGVAMIFVKSSDPVVALAMVACLYHLLNHAVFKGLLYMATGSLDNLTGGRGVKYKELGGLIHRYPGTSAAFLVGALAISGFPPFNGFISGWLTLKALLLGLDRGSPPEVALMIGALMALACAFVLTAFCFFKMFGLVFLGQPRQPVDDPQWQKEQGVKWGDKDSPPAMQAVMGAMAILCLLLGVVPGLCVPWLLEIVYSLYPSAPGLMPGVFEWSGLGFDAPSQPEIPMAGIVGMAAVLAAAGYLFVRSAEVRRPAEPWNCGTRPDPATMQSTGAAVSELVRRVQRRESAPPPPKEWENKLPPTAGAYPPAAEAAGTVRAERIHLDEWSRMSMSPKQPQWVHETFRAFYNTISDWLFGGSAHFGDAMQSGDIRLYLRYILIMQLGIMVLFLTLYASLTTGAP